MNRKVILYVKAFSDFGTFMDTIVLNVLIYAATGSTGWMAAAMAFRTAGGVFSSIFSGILADRFDRRKIMIISDLARGILILSLISFPSPYMIILVSFAIGFSNSSFMVSFNAEIPQIFGENKVLETNALISRLTSASLVAGFLAAGILTDIIGYHITLIIDSATYFLSAAVLMMLKWESAPGRKAGVQSTLQGKLSSIFSDIKEVYAYLKLAPMLMLVNLVFLAGSFAGSSHNLGIPILAEALNPDRQSFYYGLIWSTWGIGSILSAFLLPRLRWARGSRIYLACFISAILMSSGFIIFLSSSYIPAILLVAFLTGIFDAAFTTLHATILQKSANHIRGRIFGVGMLLKSLGFACGFILAPAVLDSTSLTVLAASFHGILIVMTLLIMVRTYIFARTKNQQEAGSA
ncbi:MFS transporter [Bacillus infantis]|uniref:MFS transporter n=1 Tax=Bacillus infantis TaxID=324767 RepID=UPI003CE8F52C